MTTSPASARQSALATMVLSSGAPVNPRVDRSPRTARLASTPPSLAGALTPPPDTPDPQVFRDPAAVATAWLSALCWYDYRAGRDDNTRRATLYGSIDMPTSQNPWTLNEQAWTQITAAQTSSGCTDITATAETLTHNGTDETTVNLSATQILSAAGTAYQSTRITMTRLIQPDAQGNWQDRPAGDCQLSLKRKATKIAMRWAIGSAAGMLLSWPGLLCLALLLLVVIILSSAGGPAALAPPALASTNYSCTIAPGRHQPRPPLPPPVRPRSPRRPRPPATTPASP